MANVLARAMDCAKDTTPITRESVMDDLARDKSGNLGVGILQHRIGVVVTSVVSVHRSRVYRGWFVRCLDVGKHLCGKSVRYVGTY